MTTSKNLSWHGNGKRAQIISGGPASDQISSGSPQALPSISPRSAQDLLPASARDLARICPSICPQELLKISSASAQRPARICTSSDQHLPRTCPNSVHSPFLPKRSPQNNSRIWPRGASSPQHVSQVCPGSAQDLPQLLPRICPESAHASAQHLCKSFQAPAQDLPSS